MVWSHVFELVGVVALVVFLFSLAGGVTDDRRVGVLLGGGRGRIWVWVCGA